jgi:hypothetical protein
MSTANDTGLDKSLDVGRKVAHRAPEADESRALPLESPGTHRGHREAQLLGHFVFGQRFEW